MRLLYLGVSHIPCASPPSIDVWEVRNHVGSYIRRASDAGFCLSCPKTLGQGTKQSPVQLSSIVPPSSCGIIPASSQSMARSKLVAEDDSKKFAFDSAVYKNGKPWKPRKPKITSKHHTERVKTFPKRLNKVTAKQKRRKTPEHPLNEDFTGCSAPS